MGVDVKSGLDRSVTEDGGKGLDVHAVTVHVGSVRMPQIVEAHVGEAAEPEKAGKDVTELGIREGNGILGLDRTERDGVLLKEQYAALGAVSLAGSHGLLLTNGQSRSADMEYSVGEVEICAGLDPEDFTSSEPVPEREPDSQGDRGVIPCKIKHAGILFIGENAAVRMRGSGKSVSVIGTRMQISGSAGIAEDRDKAGVVQPNGAFGKTFAAHGCGELLKIVGGDLVNAFMTKYRENVVLEG